MNPYGGIITALLRANLLILFLIIALGFIIRKQIRAKREHELTTFWSKPTQVTLNRMHRELYPKSPLRWMWTACMVLVLTTCAATAVLNHENQVQDRIYLAQQMKQIELNAELSAKKKRERTNPQQPGVVR